MKIVESVSSSDTFSINPIFFNIMEGVSSRDTFNIISFFGNCERCLLTPSTNFKNLGLYWKCLFKRHFPQFPFSGKFRIYAEGVSSLPQFPRKWNYTWQPFIIFKNWVYTESVSSTIFQQKFRILKRDILQFPKNRIILKVSLEETPSIIWKKKLGLYWKCFFPQFP